MGNVVNLFSEGRVCNSCKQEKSLAEFHFYKTGKFRAFLCNKCNLDLGTSETPEPWFLRLMEYKSKHT